MKPISRDIIDKPWIESEHTGFRKAVKKKIPDMNKIEQFFDNGVYNIVVPVRRLLTQVDF